VVIKLFKKMFKVKEITREGKIGKLVETQELLASG
jgi:hypothetical protein